MKKYIKHAFSHPMVSGSSIIFFGSLIANILNFFFNFFMSRSLSTAEYGILASLVSLITFPLLIAGAIIPTIVSFAGGYFAKNELAKVRGLYIKINSFYFLISIVTLVFSFLFKDIISIFFNINDSFLIVLSGLIIALGFLTVANTALLQARLFFPFIALANIISSAVKLFGGIVFFLIGFGVKGAVSSVFFSSIVLYCITFIKLPFLFDKKVKPVSIHISEILAYTAPSALAVLGLTSFISTDVLLVKHFFIPSQAGIYAGLSLLGKVIFFLTYPIGTVMFPLVVDRYSKKQNYHSTFLLALLMVSLLSLGVVVFYFLFPAFVIRFLLKRDEYLVVTPIVGLFSIFIALYSVMTILTNFYLSIKKTKVFIPIILGAGLQVLGIWIYHTSFLQITLINLFITTALVIGLIGYYSFCLREGQ